MLFLARELEFNKTQLTMTLKGCMQCSKYSVFFLNFIIWLSGLFVLGLAIYLRMDPTLNHMVNLGYTTHLTSYHLFCYFLVVLGIIITFIGFLGCCSSYQESHTMLGFFLGLLVLFLICEVAMASWLVMQKKNAKHSVDDSVRDYIQKEYGGNLFTNEPVDNIQETFKCCGSTGPQDYLLSMWHNSTHRVDSSHSRKRHQDNKDRHFLMVPASCCGTSSRPPKKQVACMAEFKDRSQNKTPRNATTAFNQGCLNLIISNMEKIVERACIFAVVVSSVQLLSLICSLCLCCGLRRRSAGGYKS